MTALLSIITLCCSSAQGRWTLGWEMTKRSELRKYTDSYQYLFTNRNIPSYVTGFNLTFQYSERWRIESGLINTFYSKTIAVYYNEPGYTRLVKRPMIQSRRTSTLEIPMKLVYNTDLQWKSITVNLLAGLNTYILTGSLESSPEGILPALPVWPTPPTNLSVIYRDQNLSKINSSLETGAEAMWNLEKNLIFIYRFTGRLGFIDMVQMEGDYVTRNLNHITENSYPFRVVSNGSALHHTFQLRYKLGKKRKKGNWWEAEG